MGIVLLGLSALIVVLGAYVLFKFCQTTFDSFPWKTKQSVEVRNSEAKDEELTGKEPLMDTHER